MTDTPEDDVLLTYEDLARRWQCSLSRLYNAPPHLLPPRVKLPGSRLVRFRRTDVATFEQASLWVPPSEDGR
jgi:hypothetical protein